MLCTLQHFSVCYFVLPFNKELGPEAFYVEGIELFDMMVVDCQFLMPKEG